MLDQSTSISTSEAKEIRNAAKKFIKDLNGYGVTDIKTIAFSQNATHIDVKEYGHLLLYLSGLGISTNYLGALTLAEKDLSNDPSVSNYIVFMTDGGPTASQWPSVDEDLTRY